MGKKTSRRLLRLIDRKPFDTPIRLLPAGSTRSIEGRWSLEVKVKCTHVMQRDVGKLKNTRTFPAIIDTGCNFAGLISRAVHDGFCELPELAKPPRKIAGAAAGKEVFGWNCEANLWIYPEGDKSEIQHPIKIELENGLRVAEGSQGDGIVGMGALSVIEARLEVDFENKNFSLLVPEDRIILSQP